MGGHRGEAVLKRMTGPGLQAIGTAFGVGFVGAAAWAVFSRGNHKTWEKLNKDYQVKKAERRKKFESWLAAQPYDDETK